MQGDPANRLPLYAAPSPPSRETRARQWVLTLSLSTALLLFGIGAYSGWMGMAIPVATSTPQPVVASLPSVSSAPLPPPIVFPEAIPLVTHTPAPRGVATIPPCDYAVGYGQTCRWTDPTPTPLPLPICVTPEPGVLCEWRSSLDGPAGGW